MQKESKFIGIRQIILIALLNGLCIAIAHIVLIPFSANLTLTMYFSNGTCALICGIIYVLAMIKSSKIGAQFLFAAVYAVFYLVMYGNPFVLVVVLIAGIINEVLMIKGGYQSKLRLGIAYVIYFLAQNLAPTLQNIILYDTSLKTFMDMGLDAASAEAMMQSLLSPATVVPGILITILGATIGYLIGIRLFKKHFLSADVM